MNLPSEAGFLLVAIAALGIGSMLISMAAAIRHGVDFIQLEARVLSLRAQQRQLLIERGMIEPDEGEIVEVDVIDDEEVIEAIPVDEDEPAEAERMAA